jgi:hypothetical protein
MPSPDAAWCVGAAAGLCLSPQTIRQAEIALDAPIAGESMTNAAKTAPKFSAGAEPKKAVNT